ncbi:MAG: hypothetical protein G3M70_05235 [Candidatus Nitronauta litoralis]|uniref:DUF1579 domain-containing protein n=1 Tax=Candidatus Nitronauta litoralis TaxID=2705533 RepID=A0A7T0BUZ5_9BACT|nr:MAG: hypothetical protein G3M70_05235 [Candidatus Nitronauta litoralis]
MSIITFFIGSAFAENGHHPKPYVGSKAFEQMKSLVGDWKGMIDKGKGPEVFNTNYRLTSGGSAIVETIFEGHPHGMITIYQDDSKKQLTMVHSCAEYNQPKMVIKKNRGNRIEMDLVSNPDLDVVKDSHMHSFAIELNGPEQMTRDWINFEDGKKKMAVKLVYKRKNVL